MPFPFLPIGALVAASVLVGALTIFGLALRATDRAVTRAATGLRQSVLPGLVSGMRGWRAATAGAPRGATSISVISPTASTAGSEAADIEIIDLDR
jgi:hypothetical protein